MKAHPFFSFFSIGAILESLVAWATLSTPSLGWRGLLAVSAVPSVLLAMGLPWVPESPRWLLDRGDLDQATTILDRVERINSGVASAVDRDGPPQSLNAREHEPQKTEQELRSRARPPSEAMFETSQESDAFFTLSLLFFLMASLYYSIVLAWASVLGQHHPGNSSTASCGNCTTTRPKLIPLVSLCLLSRQTALSFLGLLLHIACSIESGVANNPSIFPYM